ncbi:MAG: helix-turn-helix domain-containing protein [Planctomycetota bacterium]|jgi:hypothetical protein
MTSNLTLGEAAQQASILQDDLDRYEAGGADPKLDEIRRLAVLYRVTLDHLAGMADPGWELHYAVDGEVEMVARSREDEGKSEDRGTDKDRDEPATGNAENAG